MTKILSLLLLLVALQTRSQISIQGKVIDTGENRALHHAVISVLRAEDSVLLDFTRSREDGSFLIQNIKEKKPIVLITYPAYADYVEQLNDTTQSQANLGQIAMTRKSELLEAVIVQRKLAAIRMRGDTLAFLADSFGVRQGATVDELLRQLPGIQVDRNGEITAQGQKVNKVLVDGEEFFSEDPAVVIKNLQAEAVKEVQVFDKKSEQAEFTGIDDGERSKTINLTLKPEKKKGYFARATLSGGTNSSFDNDVMLNYFKGTRKMAAFGIISNTGRQGLNWSEMDKFGGGNNVEYDEDNGWFFSSGGDDEFEMDMNYEDGLPAAWSAGLHFSDKWRGDSKKINGNYRFLKKNLSTDGTIRSQYILPDTQYFSDLSKKIFNSKMGHQAKGIYELKFDSLSDMKITVKGSMMRNENASRQQSRALNADSGLVNMNDRLLNSITDRNNINTEVLWRRKFKRVGRTLTMNFQQTASSDQLDGSLQSETDYYNSLGDVEREELIDQKKENSRSSLGVKTNFVYTEPLSKIWFLSANYGVNYMQNEASRNSFNKGASDVYDKVDSLFSNDFNFRYLIQSAGADLKLNRKKMMMVVGSGINFSNFTQKDLLQDTMVKYRFTNFFPKFMLKFTPQPYSSIIIRYNGRTNPPSLDQMQPVRENSDPLNIRIGNPLLRQEFIHTFSLMAHQYQVISEKGMYSNGTLTIFDNAISNSVNVDEGGKTTIQPINVNGNYTVNYYGGYHLKLKKSGIYLNLGGNFNINRMTNRLNGFLNVNRFQTYGIHTHIGKFKKDAYSFSIRPGIGYTTSTSSLRPDVKTNYFISESGTDLWIQLPSRFEIWSSAMFSFREKTSVFDANRNVIKWDASLGRKFLKNKNLELRLAVYDILNQNLGFDRSANSNIVTESSFVTLRRRGMIVLQYNISKNP